MTLILRPQNLTQALELRGQNRAQVYAGGTDLMPGARRWMGIRPSLADEVMFIGQLPELRGVDTVGGRLSIGPCTTLAELMDDPATPDILKKVIASMAAPGVRNLATLGGNICNASPAGDTLPYLYAVGTALVLQSASQKRELGISDFILGPGETCLRKDEILTRIMVPLEKYEREEHQKVAARKANALSKVSFLGLAQKEGNKLTGLRLALGAVAPTVVRSRELELRLLEAAASGGWDRAFISELLDSYACLIRPIDDQRSSAAYRRHVALGLLERFLVSLNNYPS
ncbi:MAG: FAD binding domain-containing protein [Desulfarculaceae bacterium]|jgi:CO/xanthine dehydrogenase FAD-binding subunit